MRFPFALRTALLLFPLMALNAAENNVLPDGTVAQVNLVTDPGFETQPGAGRGIWVGTQNAGKPVFERSGERPHSGQIAAKVTCRTGDVYARWVYQAPDLFARVKRGDRLKLSFWYRASATLGDALVQVNHDAAPGWEQYPLKRLQATGDAWVRYEAVFTVAVNPTGGGQVQLRGTTDRTGDQVAHFDDVSLEVVGHEEPRRDAVVLGRSGSGLTGVYYPEGRIIFDGKPVEEWEFMATGTGVTGLTVNFPDEMVMQLNHSAAIDEGGKLRALGRLRLDLAGRPFANAGQFRMEHDLRRSLITARAETADGPVSVEIRAHVPDDLIRIDIHDGRPTPGAMTMRLEEDAPASLHADDTCGVCFWHENPADAVSPDKPENSGTGADIPGDNRGWLAGRVFGLAVKGEGESSSISDRTLTFPARARHSLLIAGVSTLGGKDRFVREARERQHKAVRAGGEAFVRTHEAWWDDFWRRSRLVIHDPSGRMLKYQAAFDLYRYYLTCCAGERRETPPRFQIDLYRYHLRQHDWLTGIICAVEQYQSYYGAMRTGDWGALRGLASFYACKLPYYGHFARCAYGHGGARIPMWQGPAVLAPPADAGQEQPPVGIWQRPYNGENPAGQIWMLSLFCDYVSITGDQDFARGVLSPLATDLVEFVRLRYPRRDQGRMVIAPCNAGETWQGVRDPSEMVCALHDALPRLIAVARAQGWNKELVEPWEQMLASLPNVPRGKFRYQGAEVKPEILPGDQLVPAADMSDCQVYKLPWSGDKMHYQLNAQQTELYAIWPAKLVLRDGAQREETIRSYRERLWQHHRDGWNLDVAFAACLGLQDEVVPWHDRHFDWTFVLPCGLARETAPENPQRPGIPESPSLQGLGTGVIPVLEMLLQDYPDELIVLPCWPDRVPVDFTLYSPYAGRVEVHYRPANMLRVATEREIRVRTAVSGSAKLQVERLLAEENDK
jgi:hypothetical protein